MTVSSFLRPTTSSIPILTKGSFSNSSHLHLLYKMRKSERKKEAKMDRSRVGEMVGMREDLINKTCSSAIKAHNSPEKAYEMSQTSVDIIFSFPGSWSVNDWFTRAPFGETKINLHLFPSIRSIGVDEVGVVNEASQKRFEAILSISSLQHQVERAATEGKQIIFTGHSSGGPIATFATIWLLEKYRKAQNTTLRLPLCVTFGSPLTGNHILSHALSRENWSRCFIHFVMKYDIVPRIFLAPLSSIQRELQPILNVFNPRAINFNDETIGKVREDFYINVIRNASSVASHVACKIMGSTNMLLETITNFIQLSPYRPFGTYIFCNGNGKLVVVRNPDAVLQLMFFTCQWSSEPECAEVTYKSLKQHFNYGSELEESLGMQNVVDFIHLAELPLSAEGAADHEIATALQDLGLSTRARLCLRAAGEVEKQKRKLQLDIDNRIMKIEENLHILEEYQAKCEVHKVGYYNAFKLQKYKEDFHANVKRLELAGIWDEIIEMLKRYELPDEFEGRKKWIELGTRFRRIVEPLDIANYYRHAKNEDTGPYMFKARPKRYRFTQRWREHAEGMEVRSINESCLWAEVEELCIKYSNNGDYEDIKQRVLQLERDISKWNHAGIIGKDVFLEDSIFVKWWKTLPTQHQSESCIKGLITAQENFTY